MSHCSVHQQCGFLHSTASIPQYQTPINQPLNVNISTPPATQLLPYYNAIIPAEWPAPPYPAHPNTTGQPLTTLPQTHTYECFPQHGPEHIQDSKSKYVGPPSPTPQNIRINLSHRSPTPSPTTPIPPLARLLQRRNILLLAQHPHLRQKANVYHNPPHLAKSCAQARSWLKSSLSLMPEHTKEQILRGDYNTTSDEQILHSHGITLTNELLCIAKLIIITDDISW